MNSRESKAVITSTVEDYLEGILILSEEKGYAQVTEIAQYLDVSKASVTEMVSKLKNNGFVNYEKYGTITLTEDGTVLAKNVKERHDILKSFLLLIGVNEEQADNDCCVMEHNLSKETVEKLKNFINYLKMEEQRDFLDQFLEFSSEE